MKKNLVKNLKQLQQHRAGGTPDAAWLASTRETLLMQIRNTVGESRKPSGIRAFAEFARLFRPERPMQAVMTPIMVVVLMFGASLGASSLVSAARPSLPGDTLYGVKLLSESMSLRFASGTERTERRLEIAGRRLDEMVRVAYGTDAAKEEKLAVLAERFSSQMVAVKQDLTLARAEADIETVVLLALRIDAEADAFQTLFKEKSFTERPAMRLALLSLDQVSVTALETLVAQRDARSDVLPEAQLSASVEEGIHLVASRVATAESELGGDASVPESRIRLTAKAKTAVEEAKELFSQGDFQAAVKKIVEGSELVSEAETVTDENAEIDAATGTEPVEGEVEGASDEVPDGEMTDPVDTSEGM